VCWSVLQCVVVCCSVLQCVAACCSVLQRVLVHCFCHCFTNKSCDNTQVPGCFVCCSVLQRVAACCSTLRLSLLHKQGMRPHTGTSILSTMGKQYIHIHTLSRTHTHTYKYKHRHPLTHTHKHKHRCLDSFRCGNAMYCRPLALSTLMMPESPIFLSLPRYSFSHKYTHTLSLPLPPPPPTQPFLILSPSRTYTHTRLSLSLWRSLSLSLTSALMMATLATCLSSLGYLFSYTYICTHVNDQPLFVQVLVLSHINTHISMRHVSHINESWHTCQ